MADGAFETADGSRRLLSVPFARLGGALGTLYVAQAADAQPFASADEAVARMFASQAAGCSRTTASTTRWARSRSSVSATPSLGRCATGLAQVLSFVDTKALAVELYLRDADVAEARVQMAELSAAAREVYADIRQGIGALRTQVAGRGLGELIAECAHDCGSFAILATLGSERIFGVDMWLEETEIVRCSPWLR